jgi:hypothetical protein
MAFRLPTFNLACAVYDFGTAPAGPPRIASVPCQLRAPLHVSTNPSAVFGSGSGWVLAVPKLTDLRDFFNAAGNDTVECPVGSGRFYNLDIVDDVAKGFSNEYRIALLYKTLTWPTPVP